MKLSLKFIIRIALITVMSILAVGCSRKETDQVKAANMFVSDLNQEGEDVYVTKAVSMQNGYSVIYNDDTNRYFAIYMIGYDGSGSDYLDHQAQNGRVWFNLQSNGDGTYSAINSDGSRGAMFAIESAITDEKDLRKVKSAFEQAKIQSVSDKLMANYGFSNPEDSQRAAKLLVAYGNNKSKREMTPADVDNLTREITGVTVSEATAAYLSRDEAKINALLKQANDKGIGSTPEEAREIVTNLLGNL